MDICIAKPGLITGKSNIIRGAFGTLIWLTGLVDTIHIEEVAAAMLHHAVNGFEGVEEVLTNAEMVKLGREIGPS